MEVHGIVLQGSRQSVLGAQPGKAEPSSMPEKPSPLIAAARDLREKLSSLRFASPVTHVYQPLDYAAKPHEAYLQRFGAGPKKVIFLGMNPGPFGMAQTGVPFGEIAAVRDWMGITATIDKPRKENPKRPVLGFDCHRSEISGERLWGLFRDRFGTAENFFREYIVM